MGNSNSIYKVEKFADFDADHTFDCGQCFRWDREEDGSYTGVAFGRAVNIKKEDGGLVIDNCTEEDYKNIWADYLDAQRDYAAVKTLLSAHDDVMKRAVEYGRGIRLLHQDPWETYFIYSFTEFKHTEDKKVC